MLPQPDGSPRKTADVPRAIAPERVRTAEQRRNRLASRWSWRVLLAAASVLLALFYTAGYFFNESTSLQTYADEVEAQLHEHEREIDAIVSDTAFLRRRVFGLGRLSVGDQQGDAERILGISQRPYNICIYERDSLVFWTSNRVFLPKSLNPSRAAQVQLRTLKNGHYVVRHVRMELFRGRVFDVLSLIPIKNAYTLSSEYLRNSFVADPAIPDAVDLYQVPTAFPIRTADRYTVAYLHHTRPFRDWRYQGFVFGLCAVGFVLLLLCVNKVSSYVHDRFGPWAGGASMVGLVFGIERGLNRLDWTSYFGDLGSLSEAFRLPVLDSSLGGLVMNVVLALWVVTFFHQHYSLATGPAHGPARRWLATSAHYLAIVAGAYALTYAFQAVITQSAIEFNFDNVLNLDRFSILAVLAMLSLMFGLFLFTHRLMLGVSEIGMSKSVRLTGLLGALLASLPLLVAFGSPVPTPHFYVGTFMFIVVYDLFVDSGESNVLWLFFWLVVLAVYSAALLFTFNEQKDLRQRIDYAVTLSSSRDTTAEDKLQRLVSRLRADVELQAAMSQDTSGVSLRAILPVLERALVDEAYLYNNYSYRFYGYDGATDTTFIAGGTVEARAANRRFAEATPVRDFVRYTLPEGQALSYIARIPGDLNGESQRSLYVQLAHSPRSPSRVFTELLVDEPYRALDRLGRYDYAVYRHGNLVEDAGAAHATTLRIPNLPQPGQYVWATDASYSRVVYTGDDDTVVLVGKDMGGYWRPMSLFSYLFVWCIILTLLMSLANNYVEIIPRAIDIAWVNRPDLKTKIQVGIIALVLLSFAMIGYVTVLYFHNSTDAYHDNRLNRKVASILRNTEHEIGLLSEMTKIDRPSLERIIKPISEIHHMDVNLYDLEGELVASSETDIFKRGVISPKMTAYAYQMLAMRGRSQAVQNEQVGELSYRAAYVPVHLPDGEVIGYMGLPYYSKQRDLRDDVSSFMGTLLNVYVFLLLIAGAIAITVANSITKPLSVLGSKIRKFKTDGKSEPLEWKARDELGDLIGEFNSMISTIDRNAQELDNARREKAWREMAQQVAHEVKNPLTPMKLSIQYLKHAYDRDPDQVESLIHRVSNTLIEQIDNLASIASTFSTFARMPEPENSHFELDGLVRTTVDLFREEDVDIHLAIASGTEFPVYADKKLLMRVCNNLIKNAIQAIPPGRSGHVNVSLVRNAEHALLSVADNGSGIPEDMIEKVFFPKFTTKSSGTGLGLAICRDIVKAARGRIWFNTELGLGTQFYVELPLFDPEAPLPGDEGGVLAAEGSPEGAASPEPAARA